ncbi:MAG: DUF1284 domain-containing protein [Candidatus Pacearchaeota archaeon]|nr:MAG: DUF1284 domain-containing protein [Candidatus Pacearchaeota archaeon]
MAEEKMIKIRAHHLLCIPRFYSGGYDKTFAGNMKKICLHIRKNPNTKIKVVKKYDDLCEKCPHLYNKKCILSPEIQKWVVAEDNKVFKYLKLKENSIHKAKDIFNLSMEKVNQKTIKNICRKCIWLNNCLKVGINKSFKKDLSKK